MRFTILLLPFFFLAGFAWPASAEGRPSLEEIADRLGTIEQQLGTLVQGDGVRKIDQTCATQSGCFTGDAAGFPVTITEPGSYRLTSNLDVRNEPSPADTTAIEISQSTHGVTLDLSGFAILGPADCAGTPTICAPTGLGIGVNARGRRFAVFNGSVQGMGSHGVNASGLDGVVERLRLTDNAGDCIGGDGAGSIIRSNTMRLCGGDGISAGLGALVEGNQVEFCGGPGIAFLTSSGGYLGNVLRGNNGGGGAPQIQSGTSLGPNLCDGVTPCP